MTRSSVTSTVLLMCLTAGLSLGNDALSADDKIAMALETPSDFEFVQTPLGDATAVITKKFGVSFRLDDEIYPSIPITYFARGEKLKIALTKMLAKSRCEYVIAGQVILIRPLTTK